MNGPSWDRMDFTYQSVEDNKDVSLPLKLLVLGDFSGRYKEEIPEPISIDKATFSSVLRALKVGLSFEIAVDIDDNKVDFIDIDVSFRSLSDFEPEQIAFQVDYLKAHLELIDLFKTINNEDFLSELELEQIHLDILRHCGLSKDLLTIEELPFVIFDITEHLHEMLSLVLHHEDFQKHEAIWRNLHTLLQGLSQRESCQIELLDVSKELLEEDFVANRDIEETALYDVVYLKEFAQYGGQPYSAIIADYYFGHGAQDLDLLKRISKVCSFAHAPFIAAASPSIFAESSFSALENFSDLHEYFNSPKFIKWRSYLEEFESSYIGLALPRIKIRNGYNLSTGVLGNMPYSEQANTEAQADLYGNPSFAFATCLINSFSKYAVCSDLTGTDGGAVDIYDVGNEGAIYPDYSIEALFTEQQLMQLSSLGFLTLGFNKPKRQMFFTSSGSIRWGRFSNPTISKDIDAQVEAQLPYMFIVSRIVHYLKVVQRDSIGSQKSLSQVQSELNKWLKRYVSDVDNPADAIRARKPLKKAEVVLSQSNEFGQQYLDLTIVPHLRYLGKDFSLSLSVSVD